MNAKHVNSQLPLSLLRTSQTKQIVSTYHIVIACLCSLQNEQKSNQKKKKKKKKIFTILLKDQITSRYQDIIAITNYYYFFLRIISLWS